jgi:hypothetical protein
MLPTTPPEFGDDQDDGPGIGECTQALGHDCCCTLLHVYIHVHADRYYTHTHVPMDGSKAEQDTSPQLLSDFHASTAKKEKANSCDISLHMRT